MVSLAVDYLNKDLKMFDFSSFFTEKMIEKIDTFAVWFFIITPVIMVFIIVGFMFWLTHPQIFNNFATWVIDSL